MYEEFKPKPTVEDNQSVTLQAVLVMTGLTYRYFKKHYLDNGIIEPIETLKGRNGKKYRHFDKKQILRFVDFLNQYKK